MNNHYHHNDEMIEKGGTNEPDERMNDIIFMVKIFGVDFCLPIIYLLLLCSYRRYDAVAVIFDVSARLDFNVSRPNRTYASYSLSLSLSPCGSVGYQSNWRRIWISRDNLNINGIIQVDKYWIYCCFDHKSFLNSCSHYTIDLDQISFAMLCILLLFDLNIIGFRQIPECSS